MHLQIICSPGGIWQRHMTLGLMDAPNNNVRTSYCARRQTQTIPTHKCACMCVYACVCVCVCVCVYVCVSCVRVCACITHTYTHTHTCTHTHTAHLMRKLTPNKPARDQPRVRRAACASRDEKRCRQQGRLAACVRFIFFARTGSFISSRGRLGRREFGALVTSQFLRDNDLNCLVMNVASGSVPFHSWLHNNTLLGFFSTSVRSTDTRKQTCTQHMHAHIH